MTFGLSLSCSFYIFLYYSTLLPLHVAYPLQVPPAWQVLYEFPSSAYPLLHEMITKLPTVYRPLVGDGEARPFGGVGSEHVAEVNT